MMTVALNKMNVEKLCIVPKCAEMQKKSLKTCHIFQFQASIYMGVFLKRREGGEKRKFPENLVLVKQNPVFIRLIREGKTTSL